MLSSSRISLFRPQLKRIARSTTSAVRNRTDTSPQYAHLQSARFSIDSSVEQTFSSYEYPTRTEAPEITTTKATDAVATETTTTTNGANKIYTPEDPFDDSGTLSPGDRERLKAEQSEALGSIKLSSLPITTTVPDFIPPNVSSGELEAPETLITTLDNGIRVVSQETYSQMCTIGVLTNIGSRHESVTGTVRKTTKYQKKKHAKDCKTISMSTS